MNNDAREEGEPLILKTTMFDPSRKGTAATISHTPPTAKYVLRVPCTTTDVTLPPFPCCSLRTANRVAAAVHFIFAVAIAGLGAAGEAPYALQLRTFWPDIDVAAILPPHLQLSLIHISEPTRPY